MALIGVCAVVLWGGACAVCLSLRGAPGASQAQPPASEGSSAADSGEAIRLLQAEYQCAGKAIDQCPGPLSSVVSVEVHRGADAKGSYRFANVRTGLWPKGDNDPEAQRLCNNMLFATFDDMRHANVFSSNGSRLAKCRHPHR